jgi:hypothetical protein
MTGTSCSAICRMNSTRSCHTQALASFHTELDPFSSFYAELEPLPSFRTKSGLCFFNERLPFPMGGGMTGTSCSASCRMNSTRSCPSIRAIGLVSYGIGTNLIPWAGIISTKCSLGLDLSIDQPPGTCSSSNRGFLL